MRTYISTIKYTQQFFLGASIAVLVFLPMTLVLYPEVLNINLIYFLAHTTLFLVMAIRPLADLFPKITYIRPLVILRKGIGAFSASLIVSFILSKLIIDFSGYVSTVTASSYWTLENLALFAHVADFSAILLLITSNNLSKRLLGSNWKRLQRLSYVYFYASGAYVVLILQDYLVLVFMVVVTILTVLAYLKNKARKQLLTPKSYATN